MTDVLAAITAAAPGGYPLPVARRDAEGDGYVSGTALLALPDVGKIDPYPPVAGQWLWERVTWMFGSIGASLLHHGLVADLRPERTFFGLWEGMPWGVGLAADPVAGDGAAAWASIEAGLTPLARAIADRRLRPEKALWRSARDRVALGAQWAESAFPDADAAALADALGVALRPFTGADGGVSHRRASCCLAHRAQEPLICEACPLQNAPRQRAAG